MARETIRKIFTRDFILTAFAQFTFVSVNTALIPTLPIYLSRSGSKEVEIGIIVGVFFVSALVLRPFVGRGLLRTPEKTFMVAGAGLFALTSAAFIVAPPFWPLFFVRLLQGVGFALFQTASVTFAVNISPKAHLGRSLGYFLLANNVPMALLPLLGMFIINRFNFTYLFLTCLALSLCSMLIVSKLEKRPVAPRADSTDYKDTFLNRKAIPPSAVNFLSLFMWGALSAFFPLYALSHGVSNPGLFFTAVAAMLFLGRAFGGKVLDVYNRDRIIPILISFPTFSMILLAFSTSFPMFIVVAVIWGIGNALLLPAVLTYVIDCAGAPRGPAMGTYFLVSDLGMGLGPILMGVVIRFSNYSTMFLCLALVGIINIAYFNFLVRKRGPRLSPSSQA